MLTKKKGRGIMPFVEVRGLREDELMVTLKVLKMHLQKAVAGIEELKITPKQVSVDFSRSMDVTGKEVFVFVRGLYRKNERTRGVIKKLTERIADTVESFNDRYKFKLLEVYPEAQVEADLCQLRTYK